MRFCRVGEEGGSTHASRMTLGVYVGVHDRTASAHKKAVMRDKSWKRQTSTDAWEPQAWEKLCGTPWQLIAPEIRLRKKVTADKGGAGHPLPARNVDPVSEVEPRRFYVLAADIEAHGHTAGRPGCVSLMTHGSARRPHNKECRETESERFTRAAWGAAHGWKLASAECQHSRQASGTP